MGADHRNIHVENVATADDGNSHAGSRCRVESTTRSLVPKAVGEQGDTGVAVRLALGVL